jgi:hypothetical protein
VFQSIEVVKMKNLTLALVVLLAANLTAQTNLAVPANAAPTVAPTALTGPAVPAGTALMVKLESTLATFSNRAGDPFQARVNQPVVVGGTTLIPVGAAIQGRVTKVSEPRRLSGKPTIGILPEAVIMPSGERYFLDATLVDTNAGKGTDVNSEGQFKGTTRDRRDNLEAAGGTAGGMLVGGLVGGPVGVVVGGAIGAGAATGHWLAKHGSATLPAGTELTLELNRPLTLNSAAAAPAAPPPPPAPASDTGSK